MHPPPVPHLKDVVLTCQLGLVARGPVRQGHFTHTTDAESFLILVIDEKSFHPEMHQNYNDDCAPTVAQKPNCNSIPKGKVSVLRGSDMVPNLFLMMFVRPIPSTSEPVQQKQR